MAAKMVGSRADLKAGSRAARDGEWMASGWSVEPVGCTTVTTAD